MATNRAITFRPIARFIQWSTLIQRHGGSITDVLYAKFQNNFTDEMDVLEERDYARFEFKMRPVAAFTNMV